MIRVVPQLEIVVTSRGNGGWISCVLWFVVCTKVFFDDALILLGKGAKIWV
jgi:hypothetical protein